LEDAAAFPSAFSVHIHNGRRRGELGGRELMSFAGESGGVRIAAGGARALAAIALTGAALAGCAQPQVRTSANHGHEYFSQARYGAASPYMIADGQPVPRGGGQYLVGHPYTIAGHTYYPRENASYSAVGMVSWYGAAFHGRRTANGEVYDMRAITAAHPTMPLPSYARVTNLANGYSVIVRVNDRGPYHGGRVMDVSSRAADVLDFKGEGTAKVKVEYVGPAPLEGSDDTQLLASLKTDGSPASIDGISGPSVMVAQQDSAPQQPAPSLFHFTALAAPAAPSAPAYAPEPAEAAAVTPEPSAARLRNPPAPPSRPYDLGTAPGATFAHGSAPLPPRSPIRVSSLDRPIYFAPIARAANDPFARLLQRADARSPAVVKP
jgi:rare lipoprotein A